MEPFKGTLILPFRATPVIPFKGNPPLIPFKGTLVIPFKGTNLNYESIRAKDPLYSHLKEPSETLHA